MVFEKELIPVLCLQMLTALELFFDKEDDRSHYKDLRNIIMLLSKYSIEYPIQPKNRVERVMPSFNDEQFKSRFKMKRTTFDFILHIIRPSLLSSMSGRKRISPERQFLIALWKMTTQDTYRSICEKFHIGRATALRSVRRVSKAVAKLSPLFISWPESDKAKDIMKKFLTASSFPNVIGAIGNTHINIKTPHVNPEMYINKKKRPSIQLQAVCDYEQRFIHCLAGHVGSVNDQRVFRVSEVSSFLEDPEKFPNNSHLVGNSTYTLHERLMTPYHDSGYLTDKQRSYNFCHSSARIVIKHAFELLKGRFRSLLAVLDMERVDLIPEYIIACCVLHNICLLQKDDFSINSDLVENNDNDNRLRNPRKGTNASQIKRDMICDNMRIVLNI